MQKHYPTPSQELLHKVVEAFTSVKELNMDCDAFVRRFLDVNFDINNSPLAPQYWDLYAARTREIVLLALTLL